jgi:hypothetical protein
MSATLVRVTPGTWGLTVFLVQLSYLDIVATTPNEAVISLIEIRCGGNLGPGDVAKRMTIKIVNHVLNA